MHIKRVYLLWIVDFFKSFFVSSKSFQTLGTKDAIFLNYEKSFQIFLKEVIPVMRVISIPFGLNNNGKTTTYLDMFDQLRRKIKLKGINKLKKESRAMLLKYPSEKWMIISTKTIFWMDSQTICMYYTNCVILLNKFGKLWRKSMIPRKLEPKIIL